MKKFYYYEMPTGSGILWGSEDPEVASQIGKGIGLWKAVTEGNKKTKSKKRKRKQ